MKNIVQNDGQLVVKGNAGGSIFTAFAIICFIVIPYLWTISKVVVLGDGILGVLLLIFGITSALTSKRLNYLELNKEMLIIYPTKGRAQRYEIPISRISYLTTKKVQKSSNTAVFTAMLTNDNEPTVKWINGKLEETLTKKEIQLELLPIKEKAFPDFIKILEEEYSLHYVKPTKLSLL